MISVASLLVAVIGVVCAGSQSEEGCGCAPEVELSSAAFHHHLPTVINSPGVTYSSADTGLSFS